MELPLADPTDDRPLTSYEQLLEPFVSAIKPPSEFLCGAEAEKFGVFADFTHLPYEGAGGEGGRGGVADVLADLATRGWAESRESEGGPLLALLRAGASITLEPGSQLELSGAPLADAHLIAHELRAHLAELRPVSERLGVTWLGLGFHPFSKRADYTFVPKLRYGVMKTYLPTRGGHALDMMLRTSTVQANYDFSSEEDAMRKLRLGLALAPVTTAMFANSPFHEGRVFGGKSYRARVWLDVDPDRSGLLPAMWSERATFRDYVEWALDVPMFMIKRDGARVENAGQTFRAFMRDGFAGHRAVVSDFTTHINTVFPEVRLKKTIEVRGADAQSEAMTPTLAALYTGLYYDERALAEACELVRDFTHDEVAESRRLVWQLGLDAPFQGGTLRPLAEKVVAIAEGGLERRARRDPNDATIGDERARLRPLAELVARGECPADALLRDLPAEDDAAFKAEVVRRARFSL
jgi:glutamate--cysteine ligase